MESRIPLPTDNIYKFYALFGLLLLIFSSVSFIHVVDSANDVVFTITPELDELRRVEHPSTTQTNRITLLQKKLELNRNDKKFFLNSIAVFFATALYLIAYGFYKWQTAVQPVLDRTAKAQMEIAELQLTKLRREVQPEQTSEDKRGTSPDSDNHISSQNEPSPQSG